MEELNFKRARMEDKALISQFFERFESRSSERSFSNILLWSRHYHVEFAVIRGALVFKREDETGLAYTYPAGKAEDIPQVLEVLMEYSREKELPFRLYAVTRENFAQLEKLFPDRFTITYDESAADYIYESEKLATLSGKKLHGKRNHINKFMAVYEGRWNYEAISKENVEECFQMALKWRNENGCEEDEEKNAEMCTTLNSLRLFEELGLKGGVLRVDGQIAAFTLGEHLCRDTFIVHIEKAFADIPGAYPMINQQFVKHTCKEYTYVNREEDLGDEGLRKAKQSYRPVFLVEKGDVTEKCEG